MRVRLTVLVVTAVLAAGCGAGTPPDLFRAPATVPVLRLDGVRDPAPPPGQSSDPGSCDPRASYRPGLGGPGPALAAIRERGLLRVGLPQTGYLLSYQDSVTGQLSGFEVDIARHIAKAVLGDQDKIQFVALNTLEREPALQSNQVDLTFGAMTMTCDRWTRVAFSAEILASGQRVLVDRRSTATSLDDLAGRKVCASASSTSIAQAPARPIPVAALNNTDCMLLLQQGQVDAVSTGDVILAGLAKQDRNTRVIGPRFTDEPVGIGANRTAIDLVRAVNEVLDQLRTTQTWNRIYDAWLLPSLGAASAPVPRYQD